MASIDDIKTADNRVSIIPSATPISDTRSTNNPSIPTATPVRETPSTKKKRAVSMATGESGTVREKADLSNLPKYHDEIESGIIKDDPIDDLLGYGEGGPFDEYLAEKTKEMNEWLEEREEKADMVDLEEETDKPKKPQHDTPQQHYIKSNNPNTEDDEEEEIVDRETKINNYGSYRQVELTPSKKKSIPVEEEIILEEEITMDNMNEENYIHQENIIHQKQQVEFSEEPIETEDVFLDDEEEEGDEYISEQEIAEQTGRITPAEPIKEVVPMRKAEPVNDGTIITEEAEEVIREEPVKRTVEKKAVPIAKKLDKITRSYMQLSDTEEDDDDEEEVNTDENNDKIEVLKSLITEKIAPVAKKLDLKHFTISKKPAASTSSMLATQSSAVAKWPLPATGVVIQMREISGPNLELIRSNMEKTPPDIRGALKIVYDHIVSPKPESFETWLKCTAYTDYDHLFMAIYIASFSDANYLPIDCTNPDCGKAYLTDNIPIMDMVKFKDEESEKKFWDLYNSEPVQASGMYTSEIVPITNEVAMSFREPSLYQVLIETNYFNQKFIQDYSTTINLAPYIDNIYTIDLENQELHEVAVKKYDNNDAKTARSKIRTWNKYMNMFSADEHAIIEAFTNKINTRIDWFTYRIPETTCPNCGHETPAADNQNASALVFLRNRLAVLATI